MSSLGCVSDLGEDAPHTPAAGALPQLSLCWCFPWHEPAYSPGWTEFLNPQVLYSPSACSACCTLHPWQLRSTAVSPAHLLHRVLPSSLAPSLRLLFLPKGRGKSLSLPGGDQGLPADQSPPRGLLRSSGALAAAFPAGPSPGSRAGGSSSSSSSALLSSPLPLALRQPSVPADA